MGHLRQAGCDDGVWGRWLRRAVRGSRGAKIGLWALELVDGCPTGGEATERIIVHVAATQADRASVAGARLEQLLTPARSGRR